MGKTPLALHGRDHRMGGADPIPIIASYEIKVFADRDALDGNLPNSAIIVSTGDGKFVWEIPEDLDGARLSTVRAFVSVAGSSSLLVQVHNITQAVDMLTTRLLIDAGELSSRTSSIPAVIDTNNDVVVDGDQLRIDVDSAGGGTAEGLGVVLGFQ